MDQVEGVRVVAMNERLEGVTRASSKARSTKETTIDVALDLDGDVSASAVSTGIATCSSRIAETRARGGTASTSTPRVTSGSTTITPPKTSPSPSGRCSRRRWGILLQPHLVAPAQRDSGVRGADDRRAVVEVVMTRPIDRFLANGLEFRDETMDPSAEMIDHLSMSVTPTADDHARGARTSGGRRRPSTAAAARAFGEVPQAMRRRGSQTSGAGGEQQGNCRRRQRHAGSGNAIAEPTAITGGGR